MVVRGNKRVIKIRGPNVMLQNCRMLDYIFSKKREEMKGF